MSVVCRRVDCRNEPACVGAGQVRGDAGGRLGLQGVGQQLAGGWITGMSELACIRSRSGQPAAPPPPYDLQPLISPPRRYCWWKEP